MKNKLICILILNALSFSATASSSGGATQVDKLPDYYGAEQTVDCLEGYKCPGQKTEPEKNSSEQNNTAVKTIAEKTNPDIKGKAFKASYGFYCNNGVNYISTSGAEIIANLVDSEKIQLENTLNVFKLTCDFDSAIRIGKGFVEGKNDYSVFIQSYGYYCNNGINYISTSGAEIVSNLTADSKIDSKLTLDVFRRTCDFNSSIRMGQSFKENSADYNAFIQSYGYYCNNGINYISTSGAESLAQLTAQNKIDLKTTLDTFKKSCDFNTAIRIGTK
jgi:hypothetical protein